MSRGPYAELNLATHVGDDATDVLVNRRRLERELRVVEGSLATMSQVHGTGVAVVDRDSTTTDRDAAPEADALVSAARGVALVVLVADCVPLLMADAEAGVVAAVHAGRRGMHDGVVRSAVTAMQMLGADPSRTRAVLGPSVCGRCYEVPHALQDEVSSTVPASRSTTREGDPALDVSAGVISQLHDLGVNGVSPIGVCTVEDADSFSYRRDGITGRSAGVVWLAP